MKKIVVFLLSLFLLGTVFTVCATDEDYGYTNDAGYKVGNLIGGMTYEEQMDFCWNFLSTNAMVINYGSYGPGAYYELYSNGVLVVGGTGSLYTTGSGPECMTWGDYHHSVKTVVVLPGITEIYNLYYANLEKVYLPSTLTKIGDNCFYQCNKINYVSDMPDTVTAIGRDVFHTSALESIYLSKGLKSIGESAFSDCSGLKELVLPEGLVSVGLQAFSGCSSLTELVIPDSVKEINPGAFSNCSGLKTLTIGEGVTVMGDHAFASSTSLEQLNWNVAANIEMSVGWNPFLNCGTEEKGIEINFGTATKQIPDNFFCVAATTNVTSVNFSGEIEAIGNNVFSDSKITTIEFPESLVSIGKNAFRSSQLTELTIPDSVKTIGEGAFSNCANLTALNMGKGLEKIERDIFCDCNISKVSWNATKAANESGYQLCLRAGGGGDEFQIEFGSNVVEIPDFLCERTSLKKLVLPQNIVSVGKDAFRDCSKLEGIYVDSLKQYCEYDCVARNSTIKLYIDGKLVSGHVIIPEGTEKIGEYAFFNCKDITAITIPSTVKTVGYAAFLQCDNITEVHTNDLRAWCETEFDSYYGNPVSYYSPLYLNGVKLTGRIVVPEGTEYLGENAFHEFYNADSIAIPKSVKAIKTSSITYPINKIYYAGTQDEWSNINIADESYIIQNYTIYYNQNFISATTPVLSEEKLKFNVSLFGSDTAKGKIYAALYDSSDRLIYVEEYNAKLDFDVTLPDDGSYIKLMWWDEKMVNISDLVKITLAQN